jgi:hypothetical protein
MGSLIYEVGIKFNYDASGAGRGLGDIFNQAKDVQKAAAASGAEIGDIVKKSIRSATSGIENLRGAQARGFKAIEENGLATLRAIAAGQKDINRLTLDEAIALKSVRQGLESVRKYDVKGPKEEREARRKLWSEAHELIQKIDHGAKSMGTSFQIVEGASRVIGGEIGGIFGALTKTAPEAHRLLEPFRMMGSILSPLTERIKKTFENKILDTFKDQLTDVNVDIEKLLGSLGKKPVLAEAEAAKLPQATPEGGIPQQLRGETIKEFNKLSKDATKTAEETLGKTNKLVNQTTSQISEAGRAANSTLDATAKQATTSAKVGAEAVSGIGSEAASAAKGVEGLATAAGGSSEAMAAVAGSSSSAAAGLTGTAAATAPAAAGLTATATAGTAAGGSLATAGVAASAAFPPLLILVAVIALVVGELWFMKIGLEACAKAAEEYKQVNYRATGSIKELLMATGDLKAELGATDEQAIATIKSLNHAGYTADALARSAANSSGELKNAGDALKKLAYDNYTFSTATGVATETTAKFQKAMSIANIDGRAQEVLLGKLTIAARDYGLTGQDLTGIMSTVTSMSANLNATFGKAGKETIPQLTVAMAQLAAEAKQTGVDLAEINGLVARMNKTPLDFVRLLGKAAWGTPAERLDAAGKNAARALEQLQKINPVLANIRAQAQFGMSMEDLQVFADRYNKFANDPAGKKKFEDEKAAAAAFGKSLDSMSQSFGKIWGTISGAAMKLMAPVFEMISAVLNEIVPIFQDLFETLLDAWKALYYITNPIIIPFEIIFNILKKVVGLSTMIKIALVAMAAPLAPFIASLYVALKALQAIYKVIQWITTLGGYLGGDEDKDKLNTQVAQEKEINKTIKERNEMERLEAERRHAEQAIKSAKIADMQKHMNERLTKTYAEKFKELDQHKTAQKVSKTAAAPDEAKKSQEAHKAATSESINALKQLTAAQREATKAKHASDQSVTKTTSTAVTPTVLAAAQAAKTIENQVGEAAPKTVTNDTTVAAEKVVKAAETTAAKVDTVSNVADAQVSKADAEPVNFATAMDRLFGGNNKVLEDQNKQLIADLKTINNLVAAIARTGDKNTIATIAALLAQYLPQLVDKSREPFPFANLESYSMNNSWNPPR